MFNYLLVNHESPDLDSICTTFFWLLANNLELDDPRLHYAFVKTAEDRLHSEDYPADKIFHFDCGYRFNGVTDFDHHQNRKQWPSAARTIFQTYPILQSDPIAKILVKTADRVDSGNAQGGLDKETREIKQEINNNFLRSFNQSHRGDVLLVNNNGEPEEINRLFYNLDNKAGEIEDLDKLLIGIIMLKLWYENQKRATVKATPVFIDHLIATWLTLKKHNMTVHQAGINNIFLIFNQQRSGKLCAARRATDPKDQSEPAVREMVQLSERLLAGKSSKVETEETINIKKKVNRFLNDFNQGKQTRLTATTLDVGPWQLQKLIPVNMSQEVQLIVGLFILNAWYNKRTIGRTMRDLVKAGRQIKINGLDTLVVPQTDYTSKTLRYYVRSNYFNELDLVISKHLEPNGGARLGITKVNDRNEKVKGMEDLRDSVVKEFPMAKVFLEKNHHFVLYVDHPDLDTETLVKLAEQSLYSGWSEAMNS